MAPHPCSIGNFVLIIYYEWSFQAVGLAISSQPSGALRSARDHSIDMSDNGGGFFLLKDKPFRRTKSHVENLTLRRSSRCKVSVCSNSG